MEGIWPDDEILEISGGMKGRLGGRLPYVITQPLVEQFVSQLTRLRTRATDYIQERSDGVEPVLLDIPAYENIICRPPRRFQNRVDNLLAELARLVDHSVSHRVEITPTPTDRVTNDLCRATASFNFSDLYALLQFTNNKGWTRSPDTTLSGRVRIWVTGDGLTYLDQQAVASTTSKLAFVAMWFDESTAEAYSEGIQPAILAQGYEPVRIDQKEHSRKIDDEIILDIRRSRFVVADFSCGDDGARGGVYFEAGFALGLEKPVIWTVRSSDLRRVHFDTRQFNHIVWTDAQDLRIRLERRIGAVIGQYAP